MINSECFKELQSFVMGGSNSLDLSKVVFSLNDIGNINDFNKFFGNMDYMSVLGKLLTCCKNCDVSLYDNIKNSTSIKIFPTSYGLFTTYRDSNILPSKFLEVYYKYLSNSEYDIYLNKYPDYDKEFKFSVDILSSLLMKTNPKDVKSMLSILPIDLFLEIGLDVDNSNLYKLEGIIEIIHAIGYPNLKDGNSIIKVDEILDEYLEVFHSRIMEIFDKVHCDSLSYKISLMKDYYKKNSDIVLNGNSRIVFEFFLLGIINEETFVAKVLNTCENISKNIDDYDKLGDMLFNLLSYTLVSENEDLYSLYIAFSDAVYDFNLPYFRFEFVNGLIKENKEVDSKVLGDIKFLVESGTFTSNCSDFDKENLDDFLDMLQN